MNEKHNHFHNHDHCEHDVAYCSVCDVCYCKKCGREWPARHWWYNWTYHHDTTSSNIDFSNNNTFSSDCSHTS